MNFHLNAVIYSLMWKLGRIITSKKKTLTVNRHLVIFHLFPIYKVLSMKEYNLEIRIDIEGMEHAYLAHCYISSTVPRSQSSGNMSCSRILIKVTKLNLRKANMKNYLWFIHRRKKSLPSISPKTFYCIKLYISWES